MHPAFSVILFTTLSGSGYGLLFWLGLHYAGKPLPLSREFALLLFGIALLMVTTGLIASLWHLGQPQRAWRALSQWRSSWLSREGVLALLTYLPALVLCGLIWRAEFGTWSQLLAGSLAVLSMLTVSATAMIYASLRTVPAWHHWRVPLSYLLFAISGGLLWLVALLALSGWQPGMKQASVPIILLLILLALKWTAWRAVDTAPGPAALQLADALGLPDRGAFRVFEAPHTEANYITREMVFVLARRHAKRLRTIAMILCFALPILSCLFIVIWPRATLPCSVFAAVSFQLGSLVERWLFFAEARHVVSLYYGARPLPLV